MHTVAVAVTDGTPVFEIAPPCAVFGIDRPDLVNPWYDLRVCASRERWWEGGYAPTPRSTWMRS